MNPRSAPRTSRHRKASCGHMCVMPPSLFPSLSPSLPPSLPPSLQDWRSGEFDQGDRRRGEGRGGRSGLGR
jgi:hypothetical protein